MANFNRSLVNGDVTEDNDLNVASGAGATVIGEDADNNVVAAGKGSIAGGDDVAVAGPGSFLGQNSSFDGPIANNSDGAVLAGDDIGAANTGIATNSILAGDDVSDSVSGQGNVGISPDGGGLDNAALNFGEGTVVGGGSTFGDKATFAGRDATALSDDDINLDFSERNEVNNSSDVAVGSGGSTTLADQSDTEVLFNKSFNEDNDSFRQDNDVFQNREDNDITHIVDFD